MARILVIDDDPVILEVLTGILVAAGHDVTAATNGLDGMKHFYPDSHDLVITDVCMPYIDGADVVRVLHREAPKVPVIVITAHQSIEKGANSLPTQGMMSQLGAATVLTKPFSPEALMTAVNASLPSN